MQIVPGILTDDIKIFEQRVELVRKGASQGLIEWVQVDFIDGIYANNKTLRPRDIELGIKNKGLGLKFEAHLMVDEDNLQEWMKGCYGVGFDRIMPQVEVVKDQVSWVSLVKGEWGLECGLSIDAQTPILAIKEEVGRDLDVVQVMTIEAGFSGRKMKNELLEKVKQLSVVRDQLSVNFQIEVDGGVKLENVNMLRDLGVDMAEVNSGLFGSGDFGENLRNLYAQLAG